MLQISQYTFLQTDRGSPELQMLTLLSVSQPTGVDLLLYLLEGAEPNHRVTSLIGPFIA